MLDSINNFALSLSQYLGLITFIVGLGAVYLYLKQKKDAKREAALLILQEIRYAEQRVRNYRSYGSFSFNEKLLPTNSWHKNIHLFVKDLKETELDLISKFFSSAAYLDEVIQAAADHSNKTIIEPDTPIVSEGDIPSRIASADLSAASQKLVEGVSKTIEYIYNTPAIDKLRSISVKPWYAPY